MSSDTISSAARVAILAAFAGVAACAGNTPHKFGQYIDLAPSVIPTRGERQPLHVTIQLGHPANVAVFYVVPGRPSVLLYPEDSTATQYLEGGSHLVATALAKNAMSDTSRLIRRPAAGGVPMGTNNARNGRGTFSDQGPLGFGQHGYLLVYASQQPLPYKTLSSKVSGLSVPAYDDDALNTVTKLIRETTQTTGPWAAYATDFPP